MADSWSTYWDSDGSMRGDFWSAHAKHFVRQLTKEFSFGPTDVILDIGCGNGLIAAELSSLVKEVHAADTSLRHIERARDEFSHIDNIYFHVLPETDYLSISNLPVRKVTWMHCVSVIQYYRSLDEVEKLILQARTISTPSCQMLLADLLVDYSLLADLWGSLWGALRFGCVRQKAAEFVDARAKGYKPLRQRLGLLHMGRAELLELTRRVGCRSRFVNRRLTLNSWRKHLLLDIGRCAS
jgi:SAM-dependent methyltransferase